MLQSYANRQSTNIYHSLIATLALKNLHRLKSSLIAAGSKSLRLNTANDC
jgi:hypothetical protein